jgi:NADH:ubiquinone reductase (H+-translocating)
VTSSLDKLTHCSPRSDPPQDGTNPLTRLIPIEPDRSGRIPVDEFMRVKGVDKVFAASDSAWSMMDDVHASVMSCQHGRPMGRIAGHNVVCDLLGLPMLPLRIAWYVTVLDLGPWGALYTARQVLSELAGRETSCARLSTVGPAMFRCLPSSRRR